MADATSGLRLVQDSAGMCEGCFVLQHDNAEKDATILAQRSVILIKDAELRDQAAHIAKLERLVQANGGAIPFPLCGERREP